MKQKNWAERLESHLKGYRKSPSRDLWEGIEASLDKQGRQSRVMPIRRWLVAAALLGVVFIGGYLLWKPAEPAVMAEATQSLGKELPPEEKITTSYETKTSETSERLRKTSLSRGSLHDKTPYSSKESNQQEVSSMTNGSYSPRDITLSEETLESESLQHPQDDLQSEPSHQENIHDMPIPSRDYEPYKLRHKPSRMEMGLYALSGSGNFQNRNGVMMNPALQNQLARTRTEQAYLVGFEERQSHDQPIAFGISLNFPLTNKLMFGTGVVYTKLNSDFINIIPSSQIHRQQSLHYMGIPISLQYYLLQWRWLSAYVSASTQADWNIKADANTDGIEQTMSKDRLQFSIGGSLGLQYNPLPQIGIYAEPGIRHYFDNGSKISNYFKDKPTSFSLQLGLRLSLMK